MKITRTLGPALAALTRAIAIAATAALTRAIAIVAAAALVTLFSTSLAPAPARAALGWRTLRTDHFTVFYPRGYEAQAWEALASLERSRPAVESLTTNRARHASIVIEDVGSLVNGGTDPVNESVHLFTYAPGIADFPSDSWWSEVATHEYTHLLHLTRRRGIPGLVAGAFGNALNPMTFSPGWASEGLAVYEESQRSPHSGRLNDGFFDDYLRAANGDQRFPSLTRATASPLEYPFGVQYVAGGEFHGWIARRYGERKFSEFYGAHAASPWSYLSPLFPSVGLDRTAEKVFGRSFPILWRDFAQAEAQRLPAPRRSAERLTHDGWELRDLLIEGGTLYYTRAYPVRTAAFSTWGFNQIWARDLASGAERPVLTTTAPIVSPFRIARGHLYYATSELRRGYANTSAIGFGVVSLLHEHDLATGGDRVIRRGAMRGFALLADGRVLYAHDRRDAFGSELRVLDPATGRDSLRVALELLVDEIAVDGDRCVLTARPDGEQYSLYRLDLATGETAPLVRTPFVEGRASIAGDLVFFSANYGRSYAAYAIDLSTGTVSRLTDGGYASSPVYEATSRTLYFAGLSSYGNDLFRIRASFAPFALPADSTVSGVAPAIDRGAVTRGGYLDNLKHMAPRALHVPWVSDDGNAAGLLMVGADAIGHIPQYVVAPLYDWRRHHPRFIAGVESQHFAPLLGSVTYDDASGEALYGSLVYPLVLRLSPGVQNLVAGTSVYAHDAWHRRELRPFASMLVAWPTTVAFADVTVPIERRSWDSSINRNARIADLGLARKVRGGQVLAQARGVDDPMNLDNPFDTLRGYDDELPALRGGEAAIDASAPLYKVRRGLWGIATYVEGLYGGVFVDGAAGEHARTRLAYGAEIHAELDVTTFAVPVDFGWRVVQNREGRARGELFASSRTSLASAFGGAGSAMRRWRGPFRRWGS